MTRTAAFSPFDLIDGDRTRGIVILADHARNLLPEEYGDLGLPAHEFDRHIAYDIGVEMVTRSLARQLDAPALLCGYSRLLIDPNRGEDDPTLIRQLYDGTIIPANYPMTPDEREKRLELFYRPYHDAIGAMISSVASGSGRAPLVVSIHSFTPAMQGIARPWHVGILWDQDDRAVRPMLDALSSDPTLVVGDNEPYDGALRGDTMYKHAIAHGYPHMLVELRQDLVATEADAERWADRLAPILDRINARPDIHAVKHFGSRTGPVQGGSNA